MPLTIEQLNQKSAGVCRCDGPRCAECGKFVPEIVSRAVLDRLKKENEWMRRALRHVVDVCYGDHIDDDGCESCETIRSSDFEEKPLHTPDF